MQSCSSHGLGLRLPGRYLPTNLCTPCSISIPWSPTQSGGRDAFCLAESAQFPPATPKLMLQILPSHRDHCKSTCSVFQCHPPSKAPYLQDRRRREHTSHLQLQNIRSQGRASANPERAGPHEWPYLPHPSPALSATLASNPASFSSILFSQRVIIYLFTVFHISLRYKLASGRQELCLACSLSHILWP